MTEWQAYEAVTGPLGGERLDELFAMLMSVIANVNRPKRQRAYEVKVFRPRWDPGAPAEVRPEMSGEDMLRQVKSLHRRMGGGKGGHPGGPHDQDRD